MNTKPTQLSGFRISNLKGAKGMTFATILFYSCHESPDYAPSHAIIFYIVLT